MGCVGFGFGFGFGVKLAQCRIMLITGDQQFNPWWYLRHYDESLECAHVSINVRGSFYRSREAACCRFKRTLMGCTDLLIRRAVGSPISVLSGSVASYLLSYADVRTFL